MVVNICWTWIDVKIGPKKDSCYLSTTPVFFVPFFLALYFSLINFAEIFSVDFPSNV